MLETLLKDPQLQEILLVALPASISIATLGYDLCSIFGLPKSIRICFNVLSRPFQNFLTLDDLEETPGGPVDVVLWKARVLTNLTFANALGWLTYTVYSAAIGEYSGTIRSVITCITWAYASIRIVAKPPRTSPYLLILFCLSHVFSSSVDLASHITCIDINRDVLMVDLLRILMSVLVIWVAGSLPLQDILPASNVAKSGDVSSSSLSCPEDSVTLWSWFTFSFVEPVYESSAKKRLDDEDVWTLSPYFKHKNLFKKYLAYSSRYPSHSLLRFLVTSNSLDLILDISLEFWSAIIGFVPAYGLQKILSALASPTPSSRATAYYWAFIVFLAHLTFAQKDLIQSWHSRRCYERTRGQIFCLLHWKALRRQDISGKIDKTDNENDGDNNGSPADLGKIVNLMRGDAYAVAQRFWDISTFFTAPVRFVIAIVFLYQVLGWSALSAIAVVLVAYVLNYPLAKYSLHITRKAWKARDSRMDVVNELLQNIRFLKYYGWENHWARKARDARGTELRWRVKDNIVSIAISFIWIWMPSATALTSFLCYTLIAGEKLTVSKAFTSIALFSQLQGPMMSFPGIIFGLLHAYVSMQRINEFLNEDEVPDWACSLKAGNPTASTGSTKIGFSDATFHWHGAASVSSAQFQLGPLNVSFPDHGLTLISGATASGKSAVLAALLGEMDCIAGTVHLDKSNHQVAYCAQHAWLEHATIRDNIIFGSIRGYDEARYHTVVEACALIKDLDILEAGDLTEIGEKGIVLSGGQRARIALARALYSEATCILLDDPLAAVDMHTALHLVEHCFSGELARDRTIILVTHHIRLCLPIASYLVELSEGQVLRQGSIAEFEDLGQLQQIVEAEDKVEEIAAVETPENEADLTSKPQEVLPDDRAKKGKLIEAEARAEGRVSLRTYWTYIRAAGIFPWCLTICLMLLIRVINIGNQVFLAKWGEAYDKAETSPSISAPIIVNNDPWSSRLPPPEINVKPWLMVYLYISMAGGFTLLFYVSLGYYASLQASRSLFLALLQRLSRAPARFFDVTPVGRILNRFTTDIDTVDYALQGSGQAALSGVFNFIASFLTIVIVVPTFAPFALIIAWLYVRLAPAYVRTSRDLRRLESVSLSPAFSGFDELLRGLAHVRAFGMEVRYHENFFQKVDRFQSFDHIYWLVSGWLMWRYDCLGSVVVYSTTLFALLGGVSEGWAALVIVQAGIFADASRSLVRVAAQLELDFNSVERIVEYLDVPQEAPPIIEKSRPPAYWPSTNGELVVENLSVRYAPDLPDILRNLSFTVKPSEKIGVVGRTGSGKSTLVSSLLRMVEPSGGRILIDGIDISTIGLEDLRTRITIVSQDVSLFTGTLRSNLDPFGEHTDEECWDIVTRCHLSSTLGRTSGRRDLTLDMPISQSGSLSAGERQLVALARAVLRRTNIVVMDEATSQIDSQLDDQIQKTIREELSDTLVVTIAHRLKTIIDYDRILVLDAGEIVEFGKPGELLKQNGSAFREMCRKSADWHILASSIGNSEKE